jgi:hypothetical protein
MYGINYFQKFFSTGSGIEGQWNSTIFKFSFLKECVTEFYAQHSILFITYESAQWAKVLHITRLERRASEKQSSLLVRFVS